MNVEKTDKETGQPANILVVDDATANLQVLTGMLKERGYRVRPVRSGKLALLAAETDPPDLILLDINMPEMNGLEVCEHLKADDKLKGIPVIFISALTESLDKVQAFAAGGVDYITKPFQMAELHARVETHLKLRRLQIALQVSEARYRRLFETAKDGLLILDAGTGRVIDSNPFMSEFLGYSNGEFSGKHLWEIGLFCDKSANEAALRELQEKGYLHCAHLLLETKHGQQVEVEFVGNVFTDERQCAIQCNVRDITQRRTTERAFAKALVYADDIIATLREPFVVLDSDLRVKTANRSFYDSFRVSKEETENCFVYDLGNGQWDIPGLRTLLNQVLSHSETIHDFEVEHTFPSLGCKTMLLNARPFPPDSKHPELILLAVEDVSALRERANELAEADRRKDEFLAMLSHELRNPLAAILNATQLLQFQKGENAVQQKALAIIGRQVGQLTHLVDDLMDVSRTIAGRIQLLQEQVTVRGIIERAVETARPLIDQRRHELTVSLPPDQIFLYADGSRLEQVVTNLLTNAAKYTHEGGHIWLSVEKEGDNAVLRVRDTGLGITPEFLPHVFDLFAQAERSSDRSQGGLGIGLALVKRLVELHGGTIEVFSTLGQGSEFVVSLVVYEPGSPSLKMQPPPADRSPKLGRRALRVLVVEDNLDAATALEMLLEGSGHRVLKVHTGEAALAAALDFRPDVMLADIGLPEVDGFEVAKLIRQHSVLHNIVLVALTGYGSESDRQRSLDNGFDHHLVKPAHFGKLQDILATISAKTN